MQSFGALFTIWIVYLLLSDRWEIGNLVLGLGIAAGILALMRPKLVRPDWRRLPGAGWALVRYLWVMLYDMLISGVQVARILLQRKLSIEPGIMAIPSGCQSELGTALSAHAITLSPGELVVEMDQQGVLYTHCLDITRAAQYISQAQEMRRNLLSKILD